MESNNLFEGKSKEEIIAEFENADGSQKVDNIVHTAKLFLEQELNLIRALGKDCTSRNIMRALSLALTHDIEMSKHNKTELKPKEQVLAAHIAKSLDLKLLIQQALTMPKKEGETDDRN